MPSSSDVDVLIEHLCHTCNIKRVTREEGKTGAPAKANADDLRTVISAIYSILQGLVKKDNENYAKFEKLEAEIKDLSSSTKWWRT